MLIFHISFSELFVDTILRIILLLISTTLRPSQKLFCNVIFVRYIDPSRDGNGYPVPAYPAGKNPIRVRVWDYKIPMGI